MHRPIFTRTGRRVYAAGIIETRLRSVRLSNSTVPSTRAKSVWSRPMPTLVSGIEARTALPHDDVSGDHSLAAKALYAEALGIRIPPVASRAGALLRSEELKIKVEHSRAIVAKRAEKATLLGVGGRTTHRAVHRDRAACLVCRSTSFLSLALRRSVLRFWPQR